VESLMALIALNYDVVKGIKVCTYTWDKRRICRTNPWR